MKFKSNVDIEAALAVSQNATFAGNVTIGDNSASEIFLAFNSSATDFALGANGSNFMIGTSSDLDSGNLITLSGTNGRLGIGTTSPSEKLDVVGNIELGDGGTGAALKYNSTNRGTILVNGSEIMRLEAAGNVGIGTTAPDSKLSVTSATLNSEDILYLKSGADNANDYLGIAWELGVGGNGPHSAIRSFAGPSGSDARLGFLTTSDGGTTLTEGLSVAHNGNVGIGTTSPDAPLTVHSSTDPEIRFGYSSTQDHRIQWDSSKVFIHADPENANANSAIALAVDGGTKLYIPDSGNVGIGTTNPGAKLDIHTATNTNGLLIREDTDDSITHNFYVDSSDNGVGVLYANGQSAKIQLNTAGNSYFNGGAVLINATAVRDASNPAKFSLQGGMSEFDTILSNGYDWANSPVSILERANIGTTSHDNKYSPNLNFHWSGRVSNSLWMGANGHLNWGSYTSAGVPAADGTFNAGSATFAGNVGIGTTSPQAALHVAGAFNSTAPTGNGVLMGFYSSSHGYIQLNGPSGGYIDFSTSGTDHKGRLLYDNTSNYMRFDTNGSEKMRIDSAGNVGIGATSVPSEANLSLGAKTTTEGGHLVINKATSSTHATHIDNNTDTFRIMKGTDSASGSVQFILNHTNGNVGIGTTGPNAKLDVVGNTRLGSGTLHVSTDQTFGTGFTYSFRDAVGILNPNGTSAASATAVMSIGGMSNGYSLVTTGNVGIGNAAPAQRLHVAGNQVRLDTAAGGYYLHNGSGTFRGAFHDNGTVTSIYADGNGSTAAISIDSNNSTFAGDVSLADSKKLKFGAGNDLQIYHGGGNSDRIESLSSYLILEASNLILRNNGGTEDYAKFVGNGGVELYHNNSKKFETASTGVTVTGKISGLTAGTANTDAVNVQQLNNATTGTLIYKGTWSAAPTTTSVLDGAVSGGTIVIEAANPGISVGATITGTGISGTVTVSNIAADGITIAISSSQTIADGTTLTFTTVGGTPDLSQASRKVTGHYYICETAGAVTPNGAGTTPNEWAVGDWATFSDLTTDAWQKIDNSSVLSGAGTGGKVPVWSGSGTSVTLADAPITVSGNNATFAGNVAMATGNATGKFAVKSTGVHASYDFYNNGTSYFNGGVVVDAGLSQTGGADVTFTGTVDTPQLKVYPSSSSDTSGTATIELGVGSTKYWSLRQAATAEGDLVIDRTYSSANTEAFRIARSTGNATFAGKVSVGGGDTSTAQVALKGQQSLLSFVRGTSGDAQFFMSSDSSRLYFSHTDIQSTNLILTLNQDKTATFAGNIDAGAAGKLSFTGTSGSPDLIIKNNSAASSTSGTATLQFKQALNSTGGKIVSGRDADYSSGTTRDSHLKFYTSKDATDTLALTLNSSQNATFGGDVTLSAAGSTGEIIRTTDNTEPYFAFQRNSGSNGVGVLRLLDGGDLAFDTGATGTGQSTRLTIDGATGNATFAGSIYANTIYSSTNSSYYIDVVATGLGLNTAGSATFAGSITAGGDITATGADFTLAHAAGATVYLRRDDTSISDGNVLGLINFQGDDPTNGTFNTGVALMGRAAGDWASGSYESEFILQTRNTSGGLVTALTVNEAQNATFAGSIDTTAVNIKVGTAIHGTITSSSNSLTLNARNTGKLIFQSGGAEKMRINGTNVGIGTTDPKSKLQVAGGIQMAGDTAAASADKVGTMRYRTGTEYVEVNGTELVTNGDFAGGSQDWTKEAGWSIASGKASYDASSATSALYQSAGLTTGSVYKLSFTVVDYTSGSFKGHLSNGNVTAATDAISANGDYSFNITATGALVLFRNVTSFNGSIDNVSVIEVTAEDASYADMCMQTGSSTYEWVNIVRNTY